MGQKVPTVALAGPRVLKAFQEPGDHILLRKKTAEGVGATVPRFDVRSMVVFEYGEDCVMLRLGPARSAAPFRIMRADDEPTSGWIGERGREVFHEIGSMDVAGFSVCVHSVRRHGRDG